MFYFLIKSIENSVLLFPLSLLFPNIYDISDLVSWLIETGGLEGRARRVGGCSVYRVAKFIGEVMGRGR